MRLTRFLYRTLGTEKWANLSLLQLRDELARRGLKRSGTKAELIARLTEQEHIQAAAVEAPTTSLETEEELEFAHLKHLTKSHLLQEIQKRRPSQELSVRSSKQKLIDVLSARLIDERSLNFEVSDAKTLLMSLHQSHRSVATPVIVQVLRGLCDEMKISQFDMNVLHNTDKNSLVDLWEEVLTRSDQLSFQDIFVVLKASKVLQDVFGKNFRAGTKYIDVTALDTLLERAVSEATHVPTVQLAEFIQLIAQVNNSLSVQLLTTQLRTELSLRQPDLAELSTKEVLAVLDAFPANSYTSHKAFIDAALQRVYAQRLRTKAERVIQSIFTVNNLGAPLPFNLVLEFEQVSRDFLRWMSPMTLFQIAKILSEQQYLTANKAAEISELLAAHNFMDSVGLAFYANYLYTLHTTNLFPQIVMRTSLLNRCIVNEENLDLVSALKLGVCYLPHMSNDSVDCKVFQEVQKLDEDDPKWTEYCELVEQLLTIIVDVTENKPIYHYQFNSIVNMNQTVRLKLGHKLAAILQNAAPKSEALLRYYASHLYTEPNPKPELFKVELTSSNLQTYARLLWKYNQALPQDSLVFASEEGLKAMKTLGIHDVESAYYFSCAYTQDPDPEGKLFIPIQGIAMHCQDYLNSSSIYTLPLHYNLGLKPANVSELAPKICLKEAYGEIFLKNTIFLCGIVPNAQIAQATQNLSFQYDWHPPIPVSLLTQFIDSLSEASVWPDAAALATIVKPVLDQFDLTHKLLLLQLLRPGWSSVDSEVREHLEDVVATDNIPSSLLGVLGGTQLRKCVNKLQEGLEISTANAHVLELFAQNRLFSPQLVQAFLSLLPRIREERDLMTVLQALLKSATHLGHSELVVESISNLLDRYKLWNSLPMEMITDYLFLLSGSPKDIAEVNPLIKEKFLKRTANAKAGEVQHVNEKSQLTAYPAFIHDSILEPRHLISNFSKLSIDSIQHSVTTVMPPDQILFNCKVKAVMNVLGAKGHPTADEGVTQFYKARDLHSGIKQFKDSFFQVYSSTSRLKFLDIELGKSHVDPISGWQPEFMFFSSKLAILFYDEDETVYNAKGEDLGPVFLQRVIRRQLESLSGLRVISIKHSFWKDMELEKKEQLIKHMQSKYKMT